MNSTPTPPPLLPCPDGTLADPAIGCVQVPQSLVDPNTGILEIMMQVGSGMMGALAAAASLALLYGAIKYILGRGNEEKLDEAKRILFWSVFGLVAGLMSRLVLNQLLTAVSGS